MGKAQKFKRQELWESAYRQMPYMRNLSENELDTRFADVISNIVTLDVKGKLSFGTEFGWIEKFTHLMAEYSHRRRTFPKFQSIFEQTRFPSDEGLSLAIQVLQHLPNSGIPSDFSLFKYGKAQFLRPLVHNGSLRLFSASRYNDPSLNFSIGDDELSFEKIVGAKRVKYVSKSNFLCFCSSWLPNNRLVADFEADSVLIIWDPPEFFLRIARAAALTDWKIYYDKVDYIDPLLLGNERHVSCMSHIKHFRFAYQFEHRLVLYPPQPRSRIEPLDLVIGPIEDISTLVT